MRITLCGSIAHFDEMLRLKEELEKLGHDVKLPPTEVKDGNGNLIPVKEFYRLRKQGEQEGWIWDRKEEAMRTHFDKVGWSDAVLVVNKEKSGVAGYIGANTFLEMGLAFHLKKRIFLLNQIPEMSYKEEIIGMKPKVINGDLGEIDG